MMATQRRQFATPRQIHQLTLRNPGFQLPYLRQKGRPQLELRSMRREKDDMENSNATHK